MNEEDVLKDMLEDINNIKILRHMEIAKVDYAKNIMRYTEIDKLVVAEYLKKLESLGLLEIYGNTSIKRTSAKLKKSAEVHKHHTYYQITRKGEILLKMVDCRAYLKILGENCLERLYIRLNKPVNLEESDERILQMGLIGRHGELTEMGKNTIKFAKKRGFNPS